MNYKLIIICVMIFFVGSLLIYFALPIVLSGTSDAYLRLERGNHYDQQCEFEGLVYLESKKIHYPEGFICSSWLQRSGYTSKTKCSCYRGTERGMEVYEFIREVNEEEYSIQIFTVLPESIVYVWSDGVVTCQEYINKSYSYKDIENGVMMDQVFNPNDYPIDCKYKVREINEGRNK